MKSVGSTSTDTGANLPPSHPKYTLMDKIKDIETGDWQPCCDDTSDDRFVDCQTILSSPLFWMNICVGLIVGGSVLYIIFGSPEHHNEACPINMLD